MNTHPGIIGKKLGMTQFFAEDGTVVRCSVIESDLTVIGKRTQEKDGYDALVVGLGERKEKKTNKPLAGEYKKTGQSPKRFKRELRMSADAVAKYELGAKVKLDEVFEPGQFVDVQGTTRGRGFTGVMRRWNFAGAVTSHGTHEYKRHGGSIGTNLTPGRTLPGLKMPGQYGNETLVTVRGAVKKNGGRPKAKAK